MCIFKGVLVVCIIRIEISPILMCKQNYISNIENGIKPISKEKLDILQSKFGDISKYYSDISPKQNTILKSDSFVSNIEKLSWCLLVIQIYLAPEVLMAETHSAASKREG